MFDNIGKKIKIITKVFVWIGIVGSIIAGFALLIISAEDAKKSGSFVWLGLFYLIAGPIISWIAGFFMYGFGELIEKTCDIQSTICSVNVEKKDFLEKQKREKLDGLLNQGLITQEEYNKAKENN